MLFLTTTILALSISAVAVTGLSNSLLPPKKEQPGISAPASEKVINEEPRAAEFKVTPPSRKAVDEYMKEFKFTHYWLLARDDGVWYYAARNKSRWWFVVGVHFLDENSDVNDVVVSATHDRIHDLVLNEFTLAQKAWFEGHQFDIDTFESKPGPWEEFISKEKLTRYYLLIGHVAFDVPPPEPLSFKTAFIYSSEHMVERRISSGNQYSTRIRGDASVLPISVGLYLSERAETERLRAAGYSEDILEARTTLRQNLYGAATRHQIEARQRLMDSGLVYKSPGYWVDFNNTIMMSEVLHRKRQHRPKPNSVLMWARAYSVKCGGLMRSDFVEFTDTEINFQIDRNGSLRRNWTNTHSFRVPALYADIIKRLKPTEQFSALEMGLRVMSNYLNEDIRGVASEALKPLDPLVDAHILISKEGCESAVVKQFQANLYSYFGAPPAEEIPGLIDPDEAMAETSPLPIFFNNDRVASACWEKNEFSILTRDKQICLCMERVVGSFPDNFKRKASQDYHLFWADIVHPKTEAQRSLSIKFNQKCSAWR